MTNTRRLLIIAVFVFVASLALAGVAMSKGLPPGLGDPLDPGCLPGEPCAYMPPCPPELLEVGGVCIEP